jgi:hypothetical protein
MSKLKIGQVWRKHGPQGWIKIVGFQLPDYPDYDGGMKGVSIIKRWPSGDWAKGRWFHPAKDEDDFIKNMKDTCRYLGGDQ